MESVNTITLISNISNTLSCTDCTKLEEEGDYAGLVEANEIQDNQSCKFVNSSNFITAAGYFEHDWLLERHVADNLILLFYQTKWDKVLLHSINTIKEEENAAITNLLICSNTGFNPHLVADANCLCN